MHELPPMTIWKYIYIYIYKNKAVTFVRATTFSKRVVTDWNHLPAIIVEAPTLNTFKNRLDEHWRDLWYLTEVV